MDEYSPSGSECFKSQKYVKPQYLSVHHKNTVHLYVWVWVKVFLEEENVYLPICRVISNKMQQPGSQIKLRAAKIIDMDAVQSALRV